MASFDHVLTGRGIGGSSRILTGATVLNRNDIDCVLQFNSSSTAVLTVPNDSTLNAVPGVSSIIVHVVGTGVPTFSALNSTILGSPRSGLAQNDFICLLHNGAANTWGYA